MPELIVHSFESKFLKRKRKVRVWLPPQYEEQPQATFPVIYMQDAQLIFSNRDEELPFGSWQIDLRMERLIEEGRIRPAVVIGVDNSPQRRNEYFPLTNEFDTFERFFHEELIPWSREEFRIAEKPGEVALMGSSLGGLASFALAVNAPEVFGAAGCLSPWFEYDQNRYVHEVVRELQEKPSIRVYMDSGIRDWRMLDDGHRGMLLTRLELVRLGFEEGKDLQWQVDTWFPTDDDLQGTPVKPAKRDHTKWNQHTELHFGRRSEDALRFLLGK